MCRCPDAPALTLGRLIVAHLNRCRKRLLEFARVVGYEFVLHASMKTSCDATLA